MTLSRTRTLYWTLCLALALLALRPVPVLDRAIGLVLAPARLLTDLAGPIGWLQSRRVLAAEPEAHVAQQEAERHLALERAVLDSARPAPGYLPAGAHAVHAEVIGRREGDLDTIQIRVETLDGLREGLPVVSGDCFVGLTLSLPAPGDPRARRGIVDVQLITARDARIGGIVEEEMPGGESSQMVVGALAPRADVVQLDVHNPSNRAVLSGAVRVFEPPGLREGLAHMANGFLLGDLVHEAVYPRRPDGTPIEEPRLAKWVLGIRPRLDYATGLYQVLVLTPDGTGGGSGGARVPDDEHWAPARLFLRGEPSPWREGRKLALGARHGVVAGSALVAGTRLFGRVLRVGPIGSDVVLLGDPGVAVPAIAMIETAGGARPHVLGRLRGLGRDARGDVVFEWPATLPLASADGTAEAAAAGAVRAELWTGSGEKGMPRGLLIGATELPAGPGPHELHVRTATGDGEPARLSVRVVGRGELP